MIVETLGAEIAKKLVEKIAAVGLKKIYKDFKADYEQHLVPLTKHFEEYLTRAYERHSVVSTLEHGRGRVRGMNGQTPRRRFILFRGVCRFSLLLCFFRVFCLVVKRNIVYLQATKGVAAVCSPEFASAKKL